MSNFLEVIYIAKGARHYVCPECHDILFTMSNGSYLGMSVSLLDEIDPDRLPADFDPHLLPRRMCRDCIVEVALMEAESFLEGMV